MTAAISHNTMARIPAGREELAADLGHAAAPRSDRIAEIAERIDKVRQNAALGIAVLAHDLRNPLQTIVSAASVALGESIELTVPIDRGRALATILRSANRMNRMITDWLDFSTLGAGGHLHLSQCKIDLRRLCENVVADTVTVHPDWVITLDISGSPEGCWDPHLLSRVISNLAVNAGLHGRKPDIRILIDGRNDDTVRIEVSNTGAFPSSLLPSVFEPFVSPHPEGRTRGTGLGMFIASEFVKAHGGAIHVTSSFDPDTTTVSVQLPRRLNCGSASLQGECPSFES